jgi:DNA-binding transcriptional LysR family regulator
MDTDRLRYFWTVSQTSSIHRASELLGISPAALSKAVKLLEKELETQLVIPAGRGIAITDEGKVLATKIEKLLGELDSLRAPGRPTGTGSEPLRLGSFEVFTTHCLGALARDYLEGVDLVLHDLTPGHLEEALGDRQIDLGITYLPIPHPDLDFLKVTTITMGVYARKGLWPGKLATEIPFAIPVPPIHGTPTKVIGMDGWPDNLVRREVKYRVTLMESALELCRSGMAAAFLPEFVVRLHNAKVKEEFQLHPRPAASPAGPLPAKHLHQPVYLVKRKSDTENQALKRIAKALRMICS